LNVLKINPSRNSGKMFKFLFSFRFLFVVLVGVMVFNTILFSKLYKRKMEDPFEECKGSACGKVVGVIVDPVSKKPVHEKFQVYFCDCGIIVDPLSGFGPDYKVTKTDEDGKFSFMLKPGRYCLFTIPEKLFEIEPKTTSGAEEFIDIKPETISDYAMDPYPGLSEKKFEIKVEQGKITYIKKEAVYGGRISLKFVNKEGKSVDLKKVFCKDAVIRICLFNYNINIGFWPDEFNNVIYKLIEDKTEGVKGIRNYLTSIYPGNYSVRVYVEECDTQRYSYAPYIIDNVKIEGGKESVIKLNIDTKEEGEIRVMFKRDYKKKIKYFNFSLREVLKYLNTFDSCSSWVNGYGDVGEWFVFKNIKSGVLYEIIAQINYENEKESKEIVKRVRLKNGQKRLSIIFHEKEARVDENWK